jgi:hypothetical protein
MNQKPDPGIPEEQRASVGHFLHITSGDSAGVSLENSGVSGEVFVWRDILYDGPRMPGWPDEKTLRARADFLEETTGGGLTKAHILATLQAQYEKLEAAKLYDKIVLWFDACLFDQSMLSHILACMRSRGMEEAELICVDAFPGIVPFNGLGQLTPQQLASVYDRRRVVTKDQFLFAEHVDTAFALQHYDIFEELAIGNDVPLPWIPAAVARWLQEQPDEVTGLGRLEQLALDAVRCGCVAPKEIFAFAATRDTPPQFWGDITLWGKINKLANRRPPLVRIEGPKPFLPQWIEGADLKAFRVYPF